MTPPKRMQSQTERDLDGYKAKVQREAERAADDDGVPEEIDFEPATGLVQGKELWERRSKRPTAQRLEHANDRLDMLVDELVRSRAFIRALAWKVLAIVGPVVTYLLGKYL